MRENSIDAIVRRIGPSARVTVLTGAGVSAASGVPTFRDALTGLWERFRPEDLATPEAWQRDRDAIDAANADLIARLRVSAEGQEGLGAFLEKRTPAWADPDIDGGTGPGGQA